MSNELQIFNFDNHNVEMIMFHNEPLFNARHIGECLDIDDVTVRRHIQKHVSQSSY